MRIPGSSESSAFKIAIAFALLCGVAIIAGVAVTPLYGIAVFGVGVLAAVAFEVLSKDPARPKPLSEAARSPHLHAPADGTWRVLVVANEVLSGPKLRDELVRRGGAHAGIDILAPVLTSRAHYWTSDYDKETREAGHRLHASLAWAASQGLDARGRVGDPDPLTAIEDELRDFGADEVVVVTHPRKTASWLESGELTRLRAELDVPVTHVVADREHASVEIES
jgi:GABA permease